MPAELMANADAEIVRLRAENARLTASMEALVAAARELQAALDNHGIAQFQMREPYRALCAAENKLRAALTTSKEGK